MKLHIAHELPNQEEQANLIPKMKLHIAHEFPNQEEQQKVVSQYNEALDRYKSTREAHMHY